MGRRSHVSRDGKQDGNTKWFHQRLCWTCSTWCMPLSLLTLLVVMCKLHSNAHARTAENAPKAQKFPSCRFWYLKYEKLLFPQHVSAKGLLLTARFTLQSWTWEGEGSRCPSMPVCTCRIQFHDYNPVNSMVKIWWGLIAFHFSRKLLSSPLCYSLQQRP